MALRLTQSLLILLVLCMAPVVMAVEVELDPPLQLLVDQGVITLEQAVKVQEQQAEAAATAADQDKQESEATAKAAQAEAAAQAKQAVQADKADCADKKNDNQGFTLPKGLQGLSIGTLAYLSYQDSDSDSRFTLKRGYINIKKTVTPYLEVRITPDVHQDSSGDWKLRLKYLYAKLKGKSFGIISKPYAEVGLAHMPWLDFEEHINRFRMQDTMFMERNGLFNSADAGIMVGANLGADLPKGYTDTVNDHYAGRYGSFQVGIFNGGGYHAAEANSNKVIEGRFTLRPLPDSLPGLQLSLFGLDGKGNVDGDAPDWQVATAMLSYESQLWVGTAQYYDGKGNQKGSAVDSSGRALDQDGYSLFTELRCPHHVELSLFARYDRFDTDSNNPDADVKKRSIVGLAWQFHKGNYWVLDYDRVEHSLPWLPTEDRLQLTLQLKY